METLSTLQHIICDNKKCDWEDTTTHYSDYYKFIDMPCPKCGQNVLTKQDFYNMIKVYNLIIADDKKKNKQNLPSQGKYFKTDIHTHVNPRLGAVEEVDTTKGEPVSKIVDVLIKTTPPALKEEIYLSAELNIFATWLSKNKFIPHLSNAHYIRYPSPKGYRLYTPQRVADIYKRIYKIVQV